LSERSRDCVRDKERIAPSLVVLEIVQAVRKLALVRREGAVLVTADRRLEILASRSGVPTALVG
jgi:hypothetical protein